LDPRWFDPEGDRTALDAALALFLNQSVSA
jgi:hypothetical protein